MKLLKLLLLSSFAFIAQYSLGSESQNEKRYNDAILRNQRSIMALEKVLSTGPDDPLKTHLLEEIKKHKEFINKLNKLLLEEKKKILNMK